jgi:hypothetical protein
MSYTKLSWDRRSADERSVDPSIATETPSSLEPSPRSAEAGTRYVTEPDEQITGLISSPRPEPIPVDRSFASELVRIFIGSARPWDFARGGEGPFYADFTYWGLGWIGEPLMKAVATKPMYLGEVLDLESAVPTLIPFDARNATYAEAVATAKALIGPGQPHLFSWRDKHFILAARSPSEAESPHNVDPAFMGAGRPFIAAIELSGHPIRAPESRSVDAGTLSYVVELAGWRAGSDGKPLLAIENFGTDDKLLFNGEVVRLAKPIDVEARVDAALAGLVGEDNLEAVKALTLDDLFTVVMARVPLHFASSDTPNVSAFDALQDLAWQVGIGRALAAVATGDAGRTPSAETLAATKTMLTTMRTKTITSSVELAGGTSRESPGIAGQSTLCDAVKAGATDGDSLAEAFQRAGEVAGSCAIVLPEGLDTVSHSTQTPLKSKSFGGIGIPIFVPEVKGDGAGNVLTARSILNAVLEAALSELRLAYLPGERQDTIGEVLPALLTEAAQSAFLRQPVSIVQWAGPMFEVPAHDEIVTLKLRDRIYAIAPDGSTVELRGTADAVFSGAGLPQAISPDEPESNRPAVPLVGQAAQPCDCDAFPM